MWKKKPGRGKNFFCICVCVCISTTLLGTLFQLLLQIANQPFTLQQRTAFRLVDVVKTTCWRSKRASEWGRKGIEVTLNVDGYWCPTGCSESVTNCWSARIQTHNHLQGSQRTQKEKLSSEGQVCGRKCLVDVRERTDWFQMIERQQ